MSRSARKAAVAPLSSSLSSPMSPLSPMLGKASRKRTTATRRALKAAAAAINSAVLSPSSQPPQLRMHSSGEHLQNLDERDEFNLTPDSANSSLKQRAAANACLIPNKEDRFNEVCIYYTLFFFN